MICFHSIIAIFCTGIKKIFSMSLGSGPLWLKSCCLMALKILSHTCLCPTTELPTLAIAIDQASSFSCFGISLGFESAEGRSITPDSSECIRTTGTTDYSFILSLFTHIRFAIWENIDTSISIQTSEF